MRDFSTDSMLRAALSWFSKKSMEDQMKIISMIPKGDDAHVRASAELMEILPTEDFWHVRAIMLILRGREREEVIDFLLERGLNRRVAVALFEAIRETLPPSVVNLLNLSPEKLREYMKECISSHFERIELEDKSLEMRSILIFLGDNIRDIDLFYREASFERINNKLRKIGFTEEQINALLAPMKTKIEEMANSVYSKLKKPTTPLPARPDESHFNFIFRFGILGRNELNTFKGTYTADMIIDPFITISLPLSNEEMDRVYQKMIEINFFDYPDKFSISVPPGARSGRVTPHESYYFKVEHNSKIKELSWEDEIIYKDERAEKLRELIKLITDIIRSKEEFKKLLEPRAGYL